MINNRRTTTIVLAAAVFLVFFAAGTNLRAAEDTVRESFRVSQGGTLHLDTDLGSVELQGQKGNSVDIEVFREMRSASDSRFKSLLRDLDLRMEKRGNDVFVTMEYDRHGFRKLWSRLRNFRVEFSITVPREYNVDLHTSGGSILVEDLEGEILSKTSGGSLKFYDITGDIRARTSGGGIRIGDVEGDVELNTSGGSIRVERVLGRLNVHTSGGGITVGEVGGTVKASTSGGSIKAYISDQPRGDCRLTTSGGSINVYLREDLGFHINARSSGGRVYTEFPVKIQGRISKNHLDADLNGGGPELYLKTSGGSIHIHRK
jgi:hypothetical protein